MEIPNSIYISSAVNVLLSGVVGFVFYKLITVKRSPIKPIDYARKWLAITIFVVSLASLPEFFRHYQAEPLVRWVSGFLFFGLLAFVTGMLYGKLFGNKNNSFNTPQETVLTNINPTKNNVR